MSSNTGHRQEAAIALEIAARLRATRKARKTSLRELARRTGFSASFLSQVELGQCSPSIASLQRICEALGADLPELLRPGGRRRTAPLVRRSDRQALRSDWSRASAASLLPGGNGLPCSALLVSLDPGGKTGALHTRAQHVFAYCLRGKLRALCEGRQFELSAGDSLLLDRPKVAWENGGRARAELLIVGIRGTR